MLFVWNLVMKQKKITKALLNSVIFKKNAII